MGRFIDWEDIVRLYPQAERSHASAREVASYHIYYAEAQLEGMLAGYFSVPFSNNNLTAKDLAVDLAFLRIGQLQEGPAKALRQSVMDRISALKSGREAMITDVDGTITPVYADRGLWSNTREYHPTFGVGDTLDFRVDSSRRIDEEADRA